MRGITDTLCFTNGCGYDVEIIQFFDLQSNVHEVFGVEEKAISSLQISKRLSAEKVAELLKTRFGIYLERSFSDLREALRSPLDSEFFCYRAIECLVHYFMYEFGDSVLPKKEGWRVLRNELNVDEEVTRDIEQSAKPIRHGNVNEERLNNRESILIKTWLVVEKYVCYALDKVVVH